MRRLALVAALVVSTTSALGLSSLPAYAAPAAPASSVKHPLAGQQITLSGKLSIGGVREVRLQTYSKSWHSVVRDVKTSASGAYSFTTSVTGSAQKFRVYAPAKSANPALTSADTTVTTTLDQAYLLLSRTGTSGVADGVGKPKVPGRVFTLQYKSGSSWVAAGPTVAEKADGTLHTTFSFTKTRTYRWSGASVQGSPVVHSPEMSFQVGPKSFGKHVIYASTNGGKTPLKRGKDYAGSAVIDGGSPLALESIAVRGESTATKVKKPYKFRFVDKQEPFGMAKDKTWILLANYVDRALVRNKVSANLASHMGGLDWTTDSRFTELYLNGKYLGSYQMIQSIKIDKDRVAVDKETGVITEINAHYHRDHVPGFEGKHGMSFSFKDPDEPKTGKDAKEGLTKAKVDGMESKIRRVERVLYGKDFKDPKTGWQKYLDLDSTVDYYLVREFTKDNDADMNRSNFLYTNNYDPNSSDKIFMGPVWDFDRSAGAKTDAGTTVSKTSGWWMRGHGGAGHPKDHWYVQLTKDKHFTDALKARWAEKKSWYKAVSVSGVDDAVAELGKNVAASDRKKWGTGGARYLPRGSTYAKEVSFLKGWYAGRYKWMNAQLT